MLVFKLLAIALYSFAGIFAVMGFVFDDRRDYIATVVMAGLGLIFTILYTTGVQL